MQTTPIFTATPNCNSVLVNTANTNTDGTSGTRADVIVAGANGTRVDAIQIKGITAESATQAADAVRLWLFNGTNAFLWHEIAVPAGGAVISATNLNAEYTVPAGIDLPNGWKIQASTHGGGATASYHVTGFGANY